MGGEKESEESVSRVVSAWLDEDGIQESYLPREPSCRHARAHERLQVSGSAGRGKILEGEDRTCMVCGVDDEKLTREARLEFCEADVRKPLAVPRLETASGWRLMDATLKISRRRNE